MQDLSNVFKHLGDLVHVLSVLSVYTFVVDNLWITSSVNANHSHLEVRIMYIMLNAFREVVDNFCL